MLDVQFYSVHPNALSTLLFYSVYEARQFYMSRESAGTQLVKLMAKLLRYTT